MSPDMKQKLQRWLDEASTAMGGDADERQDALLELETTILERIDERTGDGESQSEAIDIVLRDMGDSQEMGASFLPQPALLPPHATRPFLIQTAALFAAHFLLVLGATVAGRSLDLPFGSITPLPLPPHPLALFLRAFETLCFDTGFMLLVYAALPKVQRLIRLPHLKLSTDVDRTRKLESVFFLALTAVVLNFFRDDLLALYVPAEEGSAQVPLVGPGLSENLLFLNVWLAAMIVRDLLYARYKERRTTLVVDIFAGMCGLFVLLRLVAAEKLVDLSGAHESLGRSAEGMGALLNSVFVIVAVVGAALLAARTMQRVFRLAQLRGRGPR
ncbi:MAG: hypothetical protein ACE10D_07305 [Planctomycetota bacterium]